jgi:5-methylcytosine-specific restriction endonuclease McrA
MTCPVTARSYLRLMPDPKATRLCVVCGGPLPARPAGKTGPTSPCCSDACRTAVRKVQAQKHYAARDKVLMNARYRERYAAGPERFRRAKIRQYYKRRAQMTEAEKAAHRVRLRDQRKQADVIERRRRAARKYYHANKTLVQIRNRASYAAHAVQRRAAALKRAKRQRAENAEYYLACRRAATQARRARLRGAFVEDVDPLIVFQRDRGICALCSKPVDPAARWDIDHIEPVSKGGAHSYDNVQLAHKFCNQSKGNKLPPGQGSLLRRTG